MARTRTTRLALLLSTALTALGLGAGCSAPAAVTRQQGRNPGGVPLTSRDDSAGQSPAPSTRSQQGSWSGPVGSADRAHIVAVYHSHCGACHRPVAPGTEPPDRLEAELLRHRKRARLTDQEWAGLGAFLATR